MLCGRSVHLSLSSTTAAILNTTKANIFSKKSTLKPGNAQLVSDPQMYRNKHEYEYSRVPTRVDEHRDEEISRSYV